MIENDKNVTTRRKTRRWAGMPTPFDASVNSLYVFAPAVIALGFLLILAVRSCVGK